MIRVSVQIAVSKILWGEPSPVDLDDVANRIVYEKMMANEISREEALQAFPSNLPHR